LNDKSQFFTIGVNVNNLLDTTYIQDGSTNIKVKTVADFTDKNVGGVTTTAQQQFDTYINNPNNFYKGLDASNRVYFGFGRTWSTSLSFNF